mmetsp:Transcript_93720/g.264554  ORF Transcript_93720/g.264554 Transcript_93720/m.264554 type:complete len:291 (-) Transcript_93720:250-1122(-)
MAPFLAMAVNRLGVPSKRVPELLAFYRDAFGMRVCGDVASFGPVCFDRQASVALEVVACDGPAGPPATGYWKIGVGLADVNAAVENLQAKGVNVRFGAQFLDVGFLTHLRDPEGFCVELLQDTFEANFVPTEVKPPLPLASERPKVGQVTLRVADISRSLAFYRDTLGMRLLCSYPVEGMGFSLYFLGFTDETSPDPEPTAVCNREWTYQLLITTLELQVKDCPLDGARPKYSVPEHGQPGWQGLVFGVTSLEEAREYLLDRGMWVGPAARGGHLETRDPDGYCLWLRAA